MEIYSRGQGQGQGLVLLFHLGMDMEPFLNVQLAFLSLPWSFNFLPSIPLWCSMPLGEACSMLNNSYWRSIKEPLAYWGSSSVLSVSIGTKPKESNRNSLVLDPEENRSVPVSYEPNFLATFGLVWFT